MMDARLLEDAKHPATISRTHSKETFLLLRARNLREYGNDLEIAPRINLEVGFLKQVVKEGIVSASGPVR